MKPIALIDDDADIRDLLSQYMSKQGIVVEAFEDGESFLNQSLSQFSLAILDIGLPGIDGLEVCRLLRKESNLPVIMLTAASDDLDRILGLELGADDYMGKPFNPRELLARIKALLRRVDISHNQEKDSAATDEDKLAINHQSRTAQIGVNALNLTGTEFDLLALFVKHQGQVVSKDQISLAIHGRAASPFDRAIDTAVSRLRSKLSPFVVEAIQNVRGKGYVLVIPCL